MSATIHYLRPLEREDLSEVEAEPGQQPQAAEGDRPKPEKKRWRRKMPCGRGSRFKRRMDGKIVPRG
jgi:hypothetical protein